MSLHFTKSCLLSVWLLGLTAPLISAKVVKAPPKLSQTPPSLHDRIQEQAVIFNSKARFETSIETVKTLVDEAEASDTIDPSDYSLICLNYGYRLVYAGDIDSALRVIERAQARLISRGQDKSHDFGQLLLAQSSFLDRKGDFDTSIAIKYKALALYQTLTKDVDNGYISMVVTTKSQLAGALFRRGRITDALDMYHQALDMMLSDDVLSVADIEVMSATYAVQMANLSTAQRLTGDYNGAVISANKALAVAKQYLPEGHAGQISGLYNLGAAYMELGRYGEAETILRQATDLAANYRGKNSVDAINYAFRLAQVIKLEGHAEDAESLLVATKQDLVGVNLGAMPDLAGLIDLELGTLYLDSGRTTEAEAVLNEGIDSLKDLGDIGAISRAALYTKRAELYAIDHRYELALSDIEHSLGYYEHELPLSAPMRVTATTLKGLILARLNRHQDALSLVKPTFEAMTAHLGDNNLSTDDLHQLSQPYMLGFSRIADIAFGIDDQAMALTAAQLATFSEVSSTAQGLTAKAVISDQDMQSRYGDLNKKRLARSNYVRRRNYALGKSDSEVAQLEITIKALDDDITDLVTTLNTTYPQLQILSKPQFMTIADIKKGLGAHEAILIPLFVDDATLSISVTKKGLDYARAPLGRIAANQHINSIRQTVSTIGIDSDQVFARQDAFQLGKALVSPQLQKSLKGVDTLEILGAGPIMTVPFSLFILSPPAGEDRDGLSLINTDWLIKHYAVVVKPALTLSDKTNEARVTEKADAKGWYFGIGAPRLSPERQNKVFSSESLYRGLGDDKGVGVDVESVRKLPDLPNAKEELDRMKVALDLPDNEVLTGDQATETAFKNLPPRRYEVIAFATHGLLDGEVGSLHEPALVLTPPPMASDVDDGLLTASEIASLSLNAKWVILSACNTGSGREAGAAGYSGLASAFMQAGAESLLVSLWPVRDDIADRLSVDTVRRNAHGETKPKSLQKSILNLINDRTISDSANPAVWAPFSLMTR